MILERELVEQGRLRFLPLSHYRQSLPTERIESASYDAIKIEFFNEISLLCTFDWTSRNKEAVLAVTKLSPGITGLHSVQGAGFSGATEWSNK